MFLIQLQIGGMPLTAGEFHEFSEIVIIVLIPVNILVTDLVKSANDSWFKNTIEWFYVVIGAGYLEIGVETLNGP